MHVKCLADSLVHVINVSFYANERDKADYGNSLAFSFQADMFICLALENCY